MRTGEIVLVPFPFAELTQLKARPAAVIAETADRYHDIIVAAISSVVPSSPSRNEFSVRPSGTNGLRVESVIKVDRLVTTKLEKVIAHLGELSAEDTERLILIFRALPQTK
jgi:mRNA interferase MazF